MKSVLLLSLLLALSAGAQGGRTSRHLVEQPAEPPSSEAQSAIAKSRTLRSDLAFAGGPSCRDFWQASGPQQDQLPITAYRQAFLETLQKGIQDAFVSAQVASISVVCNDPPQGSPSDARRLILTAKLTPDLTISQFSDVLNAYFDAFEFAGTLNSAIDRIAGATFPFYPLRFLYPASGPQQDQLPITAWRQAFLETLQTGIQTAGVSAQVASISIVCNDPPPNVPTTARRLILTAKLTPDLTISQFNDVLDAYFNAVQVDGIFITAFRRLVGGAGAPFEPIRFIYPDYDVVCAVGLGKCAPYRWDPYMAVDPTAP
ncbi:hypothetical protein N2152v2_008860 [Parachlorella kessleri]